MPKYESFLEAFPDVQTLAAAPLDGAAARVAGLGYNRRAKSLKRAAEMIVAEHGGRVPDTLEGLAALPGIGHATAAQILAFAFDVGVPFIETNIRSVYLHEFFGDAEDVPDAAIMPLVEATLDAEDPRELVLGAHGLRHAPQGDAAQPVAPQRPSRHGRGASRGRTARCAARYSGNSRRTPVRMRLH